jgi:hypothetical protein
VLPHDWGNDELTKFIGLALNNSLATFVHFQDEYSSLRSLDDWFVNINSLQFDNSLMAEGMLLASAHSNFRASVSLALSGQSQGAYSIFKLIFECGLYALHINRNEGLRDKWQNRNKSRADLAEIRKEFNYGNLLETLGKQDKNLAGSIDRFYQWCIDFGANPNERSITNSMELVKVNDAEHYRYNYLAVDETNMRSTMNTCAQVGLGTLYIFRHIFIDRFNILGLNSEMDKLRERF